MDIAAALVAGHRGAVDDAGPQDVARVIALATHEDAAVRGRAVSVLPLLTHGEAPTPEMVEVAIRLTTDPSERVRDDACFVLGEQFREVDTPELRDALAARLDDVDRETRQEALVGLAYRRDPRALPHVRRALTRPSGDVWRQEVVAAGALGDPSLHPLVAPHRTGWDDDRAADQADAAYRLTDPEGPGGDLVDGMAELCRRRAYGLPDGASIAAWRTISVLLDIAPHRAPELYDAVVVRLAGDAAALRHLRESSALAQLAGEVRTTGTESAEPRVVRRSGS